MIQTENASRDDLELLQRTVTFARSGRTAPNIFLKTAMTERLCTWDDADPSACGQPTPEYARVYEEWGKGEIGIIITGSIPVDVRYPEARKNAVLDRTSAWDAVGAFRPVFAAAKAHGSLVLGQLVHAGRQTPLDVCAKPVSASDVRIPDVVGMAFGQPRAMTCEEIADVVARHAWAAKTLYDAGAHGVQLHAADGYLFTQFLSPRTNKRKDQYGGSFENRTRIVFETLDAIKAAVPDNRFILSVKLNSADFAEGGFEKDDAREMVQQLEAAGVDLIELSGGAYESHAFAHKKESTLAHEEFFIEFAESIRSHMRTSKLCLTGGLRSARGMAQVLRSRSADLLGLARPLAAEPRLCAALARGARAAAKPNAAPEHMQIPCACAQISALGAGRAPPDLADARVADELVRIMMGQAFVKKECEAPAAVALTQEGSGRR